MENSLAKLESELSKYIQSLLNNKLDSEPFDSLTSLVKSGRLDSLDIISVVSFLEEKFAVNFSNHRFDQYEFDTLESILELAARLKPSRRGL